MKGIVDTNRTNEHKAKKLKMKFTILRFEKSKTVISFIGCHKKKIEIASISDTNHK